MSRLRKTYRYLPFLVSIVLVFALALAGCEDDKPGTVVKDTGPGDGGGTADISPDTKGTPDMAPTPDQPQWPDIWGPEGGGGKDLFPHPDKKGYKGSPFGCTADADCFGQKCCPTPWGVKLCAPACDAQP